MLGAVSPWSHGRIRGRLSAYIDGRLDAAQVRELERHLTACGSCRGELQTLGDTVGLLRSLPRAVPRRSFTLAERPVVLPGTPAYLWGMRAATSVAALGLMLLLAGDFLGTFSRDATPLADSGQASVQEAESGIAALQGDAETKELPRTMAAETPAPQAEAGEEETLPVTALEVALGALLAVLALVTLLATQRFRRRRAMV